MTDYKLTASLEGHEDDVRSVAFPRPDLVLSASRDATVRTWKLLSLSPPKHDCSISSHGSAFVHAVTYVKPTKQYPEGLIVSGGKDTIIEVRQPGKPPEDNAEGLLLGHSNAICALDVSPTGKWVVSGSWDGSARVWMIGKWECESVLEGHEGSVWGVLAYDEETIITACADKFIRIFSPSGKLLRTVKGNTDVVRAVCKVLQGHPSKADFASASNDGIIRLWQLNGRSVGELHGHDNFIYSLISLPDGNLASSSEDRTVRIWRGQQCLQTITHPAISVWSVAVCSENGDIVTGASDKVARVFSRSKARQADTQAIQAFEDSVKSSAIPQQAVGDVNKEKLPGPEFLQQKSGTKEGQVVMIREANGSVTAHQWSQGAQQWLNVGTVVDAVGSSGKKIDYLGKDYDYVFDVDIEDGKPPLKLPYNLSQNPYEAATKFIEDNELPIGYLDQVANFITTNTQGATIGQSSQAQPIGPDPYGSESRYRPGDAAPAPSAPRPTSRPKVLPQTVYLPIKTANLKTIQKKIEELNDQLIKEGSANISMTPTQVETLRTLTKHLDQTSQPPNPTVIANGLPLLMTLIATWPASHHLPLLDLLRLMAAFTPLTATFKTTAHEGSQDQDLISALSASGVFNDKDRANNIMLAVRVFVNLFETPAGRALVDTEFHQIVELVTAASSDVTGNRNLTIAIITLYINYSVLCTSPSHRDLPSSIDRGIELMNHLVSIVREATDSEIIYRGLVAAGTFLTLGEEIVLAAREVYDLEGAVGKVEGKGVKEPRVKGVVGEIRALLVDEEEVEMG